jgi:hypothetical protein
MVTLRVASIALGAAFVACAPTFDDETAIVTTPRLLAVRSVPAEAAMGDSFAMTALYVGPTGPANAASLDWAECLLQTPTNQPGPVNPACFVATSSALVALGNGSSASADVPQTACELFGPDAPPPGPGQPSPRPAAPDATGGFYLPVRIETAPDAWSVAAERITCAPSGVAQDVFTAFTTGYIPNENPAVASLSGVASGGRGPVLLSADGVGGSAFVARPGQSLSLTAAWAACPSSPGRCSGAETYLTIDPAEHTLVTQRESMVASWYATAGAFSVDRSGRAQDDPATTAANEWMAPSTAGPVHLWIVLRDARGGVGWASYTIAVQP